MTLATSTVSVLLASDFPLFKDRVDAMLVEATDLEMVAHAKDADALSKLIDEVNPSIVLLDFDIPWEGICRLTEMLARHTIPTLVISDPMDSSRTIELLRHGGSGVIGRRTPPELLCKSLKAVAAGELWISRHVTFDVIRLLRSMKRDSQSLPFPAAALDLLELKLGNAAEAQGRGPAEPRPPANTFGLTPREMEVTRAVVEGQTNRDIAESFGISVSTVKHHLTSIFDKLGVYNRVELVLFALNQELVAAGDEGNEVAEIRSDER